MEDRCSREVVANPERPQIPVEELKVYHVGIGEP